MPAESRLLDVVALRHTDRTAFAATPVPAALLVELSAAARWAGAYLVAVQQPDRVLALEVLVARADQDVRKDPGLRAKLGDWVRPGVDPAEGLPVGALPDHGNSRASSLALRDFEPQDAPRAGRLEPAAAEHPLLLVLSTDGDGPEDWARPARRWPGSC